MRSEAGEVSEGPLVSVVLASSRDSPYLPQALGSLVAQTLERWELIVVDDGSPDPQALAARVSAIAAARVIHQPSRGLATARNVGALAASGTFVTFLDDDDYWPADRLERQVAALESHPDHVGCYGRLVYVDGDGVEFAQGPDCSTRSAALSAGFHLGTTMVRRDALPRVGLFDPLLVTAEDLDFSLRLGRAGPLSYVPHVLLYYRRHAANVTTAAPTRYNQVGREVYEHHYRLAELRGEQDAAVAITERVGSERYFATAALRSATARLRDRDPAGAAAHARDAAASAHALTRATWRRARRSVRERIGAVR